MVFLLRCRAARSCDAGNFLLGHALVQHSAMDHGIMEPSSCPEGFQGPGTGFRCVSWGTLQVFMQKTSLGAYTRGFGAFDLEILGLRVEQ